MNDYSTPLDIIMIVMISGLIGVLGGLSIGGYVGYQSGFDQGLEVAKLICGVQ